MENWQARSEPDAMSTRPDSVARLALEDGAGERDCPNRVLDATDGRLDDGLYVSSRAVHARQQYRALN